MKPSRFIRCVTTNGYLCVLRWTKHQSTPSWRNWLGSIRRRTLREREIPRHEVIIWKRAVGLTPILYLLHAYSEEENGEAAALFTLKFDPAGNWKIVKMHRMSKKELEEER